VAVNLSTTTTLPAKTNGERKSHRFSQKPEGPAPRRQTPGTVIVRAPSTAHLIPRGSASQTVTSPASSCPSRASLSLRVLSPVVAGSTQSLGADPGPIVGPPTGGYIIPLHNPVMPITTVIPTAPLLTPTETANLLRVSRRWVYRRTLSGELPAVRLGTGPRAPLRIRQHDIATLLHDAGERP
jgi:excisionase family DNA binding protein